MLDMLKRKGVDEIRVTDIIEETGICKGTFYKYYKDKYDLLNSAMRHKYVDFYPNGDLTNWESKLEAILNSASKDSTILLNALRSDDVNSFRYTVDKFFFRCILQVINIKEEDLTEQDRMLILIYSDYICEILINWLEQKEKQSAQIVVSIIKKIMPVGLIELFQKQR